MSKFVSYTGHLVLPEQWNTEAYNGLDMFLG
jgi:hypothetical protein